MAEGGRVSDYSTAVRLACRVTGLQVPEAEYRFHPVRRWRFDFCWPDAKIALEIQGGIWSGGRHSRGSGLVKEHEKLNAAAHAGYRIFYTTPQDVGNLELYRAIKGRVL